MSNVLTKYFLVFDIYIAGAHIGGFQLQKVLVVTTPGLQTPQEHNGWASIHDPGDHLHFCSFKKMSKYLDIGNYLNILKIKEKFPNKKVKQAFKNLEPLPNVKHCGRHSLSSFGVLQLINLGKYLFNSYFGKLKSLDSIVLSHKFASTFGDQTLFQSLSALLYGLLNEKQFVYTHVDKLSSGFSTASQFKEEQQSLHYFVEQSFIKENHFFKNTKVFAFSRGYITDIPFGDDISSKDVICYLCNSLCPKSQNHEKALRISYDGISHIFNLSDAYNNYLTASSLFWSYSEFRTASLWKLVKNWLSPNHKHYKQQTGNSNSHDDLKVITVDDLFMFSILRTLNVSVARHTAPASRLIIESFVLKDSDSGLDSLNSKIVPNLKLGKGELSFPSLNKISTFKVYSQGKKFDYFTLPIKNNTGRTFVRLLYNGQVITSFIPGCKSDKITTLGMCSLETFEHFLNSTIQLGMNFGS